MLIVTRKFGEEIVIGEGPNAITVRVLPDPSSTKRVRLGVEAPKDVIITRPEKS